MYFSDQELGPRPRIQEQVTAPAWGGIIALIKRHIDGGSFGRYASNSSYPRGRLIFDEALFYQALQSEIPDISLPLEAYEVPSTPTVLDLIQFCYYAIGRPSETWGSEINDWSSRSIDPDYLEALSSTEERTSVDDVRGSFRVDVNRIFARNAIAYELESTGKIVRVGTEILQHVLRPAVFQTGDARLDALLEDAREKYLDNDPKTRREAVEKLWDAWERLKTIEPGKDKKASVTALLDRGATEPLFRQLLEEESNKLTSVGNEFEIRHSEIGKVPLNEDEQLDYLFQRMFAIIRLLLKRSGRGG